MCPTLADPVNGSVSLEGTGVGDMASYSCNTGYELIGDDTRTCQADGSWSGSPPTCQLIGIIRNHSLIVNV